MILIMIMIMIMMMMTMMMMIIIIIIIMIIMIPMIIIMRPPGAAEVLSRRAGLRDAGRLCSVAAVRQGCNASCAYSVYYVLCVYIYIYIHTQAL